MTEPTPLLPPGSPPLPDPDRFTTSDGLDLAYRCWRPSGSPRGLIIGLHGIQSHSGWYGWSSSKLAEAGYVVAFLDRRGSGANLANRGDAPHVDRLVNDVVQLVGHLDRYGTAVRPRFLMGVSWGGKLAAAIVAARPDLFDGLGMLCPGLCAFVRANAVQQAMVRSAGTSRREVAIPLEDPALFTDSADCQRFIREDPFTLRRVTVRFLNASLAIDRFVRVHATEIACPALLMLSGRDRIIDNAATRRLVASFGSVRKTLVDYPAARHTLEFEPGRERFVADLIEWLDQTARRVSEQPDLDHRHHSAIGGPQHQSE